MSRLRSSACVVLFSVWPTIAPSATPSCVCFVRSVCGPSIFCLGLVCVMVGVDLRLCRGAWVWAIAFILFFCMFRFVAICFCCYWRVLVVSAFLRWADSVAAYIEAPGLPGVPGGVLRGLCAFVGGSVGCCYSIPFSVV